MFNSLQDLCFSQCCYSRFISSEITHHVVGRVVSDISKDDSTRLLQTSDQGTMIL